MFNKTVHPTRPGTLAGGPTDFGSWRELQNALVPDGGATYGYSTLIFGLNGNLGRFTFEKALPPFARIEGLTLTVTGAVDLNGGDEWRIGIYGIEHPEDGFKILQTGRVSFTSSSFTTGSTSTTMQGVINYLNENPGLVSRFGLYLIANRPSTQVETERFYIDSFSLTFAYTLPETPWTANLFIQGNPMTTQKIKQGSNTPFVQIQVSDATGQPLDLRGCTLSLSAKSLEKEFGGEAEITDAINGKAVYRWNEGDTDVSGVYRVELTAHWLDGSIVKIPFDRFSLIEVVPSIS